MITEEIWKDIPGYRKSAAGYHWDYYRGEE